MPLILMKPYVNVNPFTSNQGLVLAMDFDGTTFKDEVNPTRTFGTTGSESTLSTTIKINGTKSLYQLQNNTARSGIMFTPRTTDLTFTGDFWFEMWGYCLGQGNTVYTGGSNWILGYGHYASTGIQGIFLDNLKLGLAKKSGTTTTLVVQSPTPTANNAWNHYAVGRKDGVVYIFVNGVLKASTNYTETFGFDDNMVIGGFQDARITNGSYSSFNGYIDRVRIYNKCLTTETFTPLTTSYSA
jgi:hypothetical protein